MRLLPAVILLALHSSLVAAQSRPPLLYVDGRPVLVRLEMPLLLNQPTVLVLLPIQRDRYTPEAITRAQQYADSILSALQPVADSFGYIVEARSVDFYGIRDPKHGATYDTSPERGPGIHLLRPGTRPSILYPLLGPSELREALQDYSRTFRHVVPA